MVLVVNSVEVLWKTNNSVQRKARKVAGGKRSKGGDAKREKKISISRKNSSLFIKDADARGRKSKTVRPSPERGKGHFHSSQDTL